MVTYKCDDELYHFGIKGMKWGVIRTPEQLGHRSGNSATTRRVVNDYNRMSDKEFKAKYSVSKHTYASRYERAGRKGTDPYKVGLAKNKKLKNSWYYKNVVSNPVTQRVVKSEAKGIAKMAKFSKKHPIVSKAVTVGVPLGLAYAAYRGAKYKRETARMARDMFSQSWKNNGPHVYGFDIGLNNSGRITRFRRVR